MRYVTAVLIPPIIAGIFLFYLLKGLAFRDGRTWNPREKIIELGVAVIFGILCGTVAAQVLWT